MRPRRLCRGGCRCDGSGCALPGRQYKRLRTRLVLTPEMVDAGSGARALCCGGAGMRRSGDQKRPRGRRRPRRRRRLTAGYFVGKRVTGWSAGVPDGNHQDLGCVRIHHVYALLLLCRKASVALLRHELHNVELVNGMPASQNKCIIAGERVSTETATKITAEIRHEFHELLEFVPQTLYGCRAIYCRDNRRAPGADAGRQAPARECRGTQSTGAWRDASRPGWRSSHRAGSRPDSAAPYPASRAYRRPRAG